MSGNDRPGSLFNPQEKVSFLLPRNLNDDLKALLIPHHLRVGQVITEFIVALVNEEPSAMAFLKAAHKRKHEEQIDGLMKRVEAELGIARTEKDILYDLIGNKDAGDAEEAG